jgi:hypothetical protein
VALLRDVHGHVGALQERVDVGSVRRVCGDANAGGDLERQLAENERFLERRVDPRREFRRVLRRTSRKENSELVAAETGDRLACPQSVAKPASELEQELISGLVTERIIHLLEAIDVEQNDGRLAVLPPRPEDRLLDPVAEERAVRQAREVVVERPVLDLLHLPPHPARNAPEDRR